MKPKQPENSAKIGPGITPKDVLPLAVVGKQREAVAVRRPVIEGVEEKPDSKTSVTYVERHFPEWTPACEQVHEPAKDDQRGGFREESYGYLGCGADRPLVWKKATEFFAILRSLEGGQNAAVFRPFCDDFFIGERRRKFDGLYDDSTIEYALKKEADRPAVAVCAFEEEEESDAAFATRVAEFERDFKPKPGQKKPVFVD